jgi:hypothetical protein
MVVNRPDITHQLYGLGGCSRADSHWDCRYENAAGVVHRDSPGFAAESRIFAEDTVGFKELREHLGAPPNSASFSPRGDQIAVAEGIKLHLVAGDGSEGRELAADDGVTKPVWGAIGRFDLYAPDPR